MQVEDRRSLGDQLGKVRKLGQSKNLPENFAFGVKSGQNEWTAGRTIRGDYTQAEDTEIGKSITPGFRNITTEVIRFFVLFNFL